MVEDVFGVFTGTFLVSLGLCLLQASRAVTGGTAGLALLLSYATGLPFGVIFVAVNLPFFALAVWRKGWSFTIRTAIAVGIVSALTPLHTAAIGRLDVDPVYGVLAGNLLIGIGLLVLFRHRCSMGGFNIVAILAQERLRLRAGYLQMGLDTAVVLTALAVAPVHSVALSAAGAVVLNTVLALNHRPGRYTGT